MRIAVLGPLTITADDGRTVDIAGERLRALAARLALDAGQVVAVDAIVEAIWGPNPPTGRVDALYTLVRRLRRALPASAPVLAQPTGYLLDVPAELVDVTEFERRAAAGRAALADGNPAGAAELLTGALALWRGPALADLPGTGPFAAEAARLDEARLLATEDRIDADLQRAGAGGDPTGGAAAIAAECSALVAAHPLRERPYGLLMQALREAGRPADALRTYQRLRTVLAEELGADPSPTIAALHLSILRADSARSGNLRAALTSFVGRDPDLARVCVLLADHRLVTLVGPGGAGKTRLAVETARSLAERYPDGVWLVELAPVHEAAEVPRALAEALRLRFAAGRHGGTDLLGRLQEALADKRMLLVLDNCEHVVAEAAGTVDALLGTCPELRVLVTSREPLAIVGESLCPVGPLPVPPAGADPATAADVPAVRLFTDRAAAVRPGFALTPAAAPAVVEICRRLDGLPLAIELATARLRTLPLDQVAARLSDRFRLLTGGSRTAMPRHRTLRAVVDWSWDLLDAAERRLARRCSVFLGGATLADIEAVCADVEPADVEPADVEPADVDPADGDAGADTVDLVGRLVDRSLLTLAGDRYLMLETIRAYAGDRLAESGEAERVRAAHAAHFLALAELADPRLRGTEQVAWLERLGAAWENLTAALRWAVDTRDADTAVRLAAALGWFWSLRGAQAEAASWTAQCLALPGPAPDRARAAVLATHAMSLIATGDIVASRKAFAEVAAGGAAEHPVAAIAGPLGALFVGETAQTWAQLAPLLAHADPWTRATGLMLRGSLHANEGRLDAAEADLTSAIAAFGALGDHWGMGAASESLAEPRSLRGDYTGAIACLEQAVERYAELGVNDDAAQTLFQLAVVRARAAAFDLARRDLDLATSHARRAGPTTWQFMGHLVTGEVARLAGDLTLARAEFRAGLRALDSVPQVPADWRTHGMVGLALVALAEGDRAAAMTHALAAIADAGSERPALAAGAEVLAAVAMAAGEPELAALRLGLAEAIRGVADLGSPDCVAVAAGARAVLGDAYPAAYAVGAGLPQGEATARVRAMAARSDRSEPDPSGSRT
jgi:predicted ATPase/DNA-binding SARP family transcriptional activator